MRGVKVSEEKLVFLNTKLESSTKELMAALIFSLRLDGYRDLFDVLLNCYKERHPLEYETALRILESRVSIDARATDGHKLIASVNEEVD